MPWGYHGRGRASMKTARVTCSVCGRIVGAHKFGKGGFTLRASRHHQPGAQSVCPGSMAEAKVA